MKYRFILKKIQYASIEDEFDSQDTIKNICEKLSNLNEEELEFGTAEYHLEAITKESKKTSKIIWKSPS